MSFASRSGPASPSTPDARAREGIRILIVEDEQTLRESCTAVLKQEGYQVSSCGRGDEAREQIRRGIFDIVLLDLYLPNVNGMELLRTALEARPETRVIVMTGEPSVESSLEALRAGAWDYLPKPFTATHLQILCGRVVQILCNSPDSPSPPSPEEPRSEQILSEKVMLLGTSPAFQHVVELARKVARTDASVFITGESGVGKEMIAQLIHHHSRRSDRPWVALNCAALPETLLESEMFGHVKGAFTGAIRDKPGLLETASKGTLFLDELTEMSQTIQAKLLRAVQDGMVRRVGSERVDAKVDVRFIAATNRDPKHATEEGVLRQDLYYRLSVVPIRIPPLRERLEDIPILAQHFLGIYWKRHRERSSPIPRLGQKAVRSLQMREWKGNVRELQNVIEHAVVLLEPGCEIQPEDLPEGENAPFSPQTSAPTFDWSSDGGGESGGYHAERERVLAWFELNYLNRVVTRAGANMSRAAKMAGIDRTTLYRLMEKHQLQRSAIITASVDDGDDGDEDG